MQIVTKDSKHKKGNLFVLEVSEVLVLVEQNKNNSIMFGVKQIMVSTILSTVLALLLLGSPYLPAHATPQGAARAAGSSGTSAIIQTATTTTSTTSATTTGAASGSSGANGVAAGGAAGAASSAAGAGGGSANGAAGAGAGGGAAASSVASGGAVQQPGVFTGVQGLVGGAMNIASVPLNTITASLNQLGLPTIATAPLSAVSNLFQQAGTVYGRTRGRIGCGGWQWNQWNSTGAMGRRGGTGKRSL